jgi:hypothetical protein
MRDFILWVLHLEVHHKRKAGGNGLGNAEALCPSCHVATGSYGVHIAATVPGQDTAGRPQTRRKQV